MTTARPTSELERHLMEMLSVAPTLFSFLMEESSMSSTLLTITMDMLLRSLMRELRIILRKSPTILLLLAMLQNLPPTILQNLSIINLNLSTINLSLSTISQSLSTISQSQCINLLPIIPQHLSINLPQPIMSLNLSTTAPHHILDKR